MLTLGSSSVFIKNLALAELYLTIPLIFGKKWNLPKNWSLTAALGFEVGVYRSAVSGVTFMGKSDWNMNAILGLEANWRRFRFGARLQVGLTIYEVIYNVKDRSKDIALRHSGLTVYLGFTLWDSKKSKGWRAKRLAKRLERTQ